MDETPSDLIKKETLQMMTQQMAQGETHYVAIIGDLNSVESRKKRGGDTLEPLSQWRDDVTMGYLGHILAN